jgi:hypothetical protein
LETDRRVAEFKFIKWRGADAIRQDTLFKDFYLLAESGSTKRKFLYVLDAEFPSRFLSGRRAISGVLSRASGLLQDMNQRYGPRFKVVGDYYGFRKNAVEIVDLKKSIPGFAQAFDLMSHIYGA